MLSFQPTGVNMSLQTGVAGDDTHNVQMQFLGANPAAAISGGDPLPGKVNYFLGNDPSRWRTNLPTWSGVTYADLYPGVDLIYSGASGSLKGTYMIATGADPSRIQWRYKGAQQPTIDAAGSLQIQMSTVGSSPVTITEQTPVAWQDVSGTRVAVTVSYLVSKDGAISFALGSYNREYPLTIDPALTLSTFLTNMGNGIGVGVAVDPAGNIYVGGDTIATGSPSPAFIMKIDPTGTQVVYTAYFAGVGDDYATGLSVDKQGNAYLAGVTSSRDFPVVNAIQPALGGTACCLSDGFVAKLDPEGSIIYSTYLGGSNQDYLRDIDTDALGNAYVTGMTASFDFPVANPYRSGANNYQGDAFVTKLSPSGQSLVYSTYLGGENWEEGAAIAVDQAGSAYVTGVTGSGGYGANSPLNYPITPNAPQRVFRGSVDGFVTKLTPSGSALAYSTYLGGTDPGFGEETLAIALDATGSAYVTGYTWATDFPLVNAYQSVKNAAGDMFVTKLNNQGTAFVYSTYIGGRINERGTGIAVDEAGYAYVVGWSSSSDFPVVSAYDSSLNDSSQVIAGDVVVLKLNPQGSGLVYSTFLGAAGSDSATALTLLWGGSLYITGSSDSAGFPVIEPTIHTKSQHGREAFLLHFEENHAPSLDLSADGSANEGLAFTRVGSFTDPDANTWTATVDYGDSTGIQPLTLSNRNFSLHHAYPDNGLYTITVTVTDNYNGSGSDTLLVTVQNVPPSSTFNYPNQVEEGEDMALSLTSPSDVAADLATLQYAFDCGGGGGYSSFGPAHSITCATNDSGTRTVRGAVKDKDDSLSEYTSTVTINNAPPVASFTAPSSVEEGDNFNLALTSPQDASSADASAGFLYAFDCGAGGGYTAFSTATSATCSAADNGTRTVKGKIHDKDLGETEYAVPVTIYNVAPRASFSVPSSVSEGSAMELSLSAASDVAADLPTLQYAFDCGSGYGVFSSSTSTACSTDDSGTYTVRGRIRDKDGGETEYISDSCVSNVAPSATFHTPTTANEGTPFTLSLSNPNDPSPADNTAGFTYAFDCGSGYAALSPANTANCQAGVSGTWTVKGKIRDKDGDEMQYTGTVVVVNIPPAWTGGTLTTSNITINSINLGWGAAYDYIGVTAYKVYSGTALLATLGGSTHGYTVTGLAANTSYTFRLQACDAQGVCSTNGPATTGKTLTAQQAIDDLGNVVNNLVVTGVLNAEEADALTKDLDKAEAKLAAGNGKSAIKELEAFVKDVNHLVRSGRLTQSQGVSLVDAAQAIINAIQATSMQ
jgi:hypothetical protein